MTKIARNRNRSQYTIVEYSGNGFEKSSSDYRSLADSHLLSIEFQEKIIYSK